MGQGDEQLLQVRAEISEAFWAINDHLVAVEQELAVLGHICLYAYMHKVNPNIFQYFL